MAAAAFSTVGCAKTRHQNDARVGLVHFAFVTLCAHDAGDTRFHRGEQVVDMPAQCLVTPHVSRDARFEIALCRSCVDVIPSRKIELAQAADLQARSLAQADVELVSAEHSVFVWPGGWIAMTHSSYMWIDAAVLPGDRLVCDGIYQFAVLAYDAGRIGLYGDFAGSLGGAFEGLLSTNEVGGGGAFFVLGGHDLLQSSFASIHVVAAVMAFPERAFLGFGGEVWDGF